MIPPSDSYYTKLQVWAFTFTLKIHFTSRYTLGYSPPHPFQPLTFQQQTSKQKINKRNNCKT